MASGKVSRTAASGKNLRTALAGQLLTVTVNLLSRRIFIRLLGSEYAGFSGLCGHLLNFLSILEPGFDMACTFALYRPLAFGDGILTSQICRYIESIYRRLSVITAILGLALFPVALRLSQDSIDITHISVIWIMSVLEMSLSYLFSHRRILPLADQKGYVVTAYGYVFFILSQLLRLLVLVKTGSYTGYLAAGIAVSLLEETLLYRRIGKMYPCLSFHPYPLGKSEKKEITSGAKALFCGRLGGILCGSVDNMAVFTFLGLHSGAMYSNYTMLLGTCLSFVGIMTGAVSAGIGNLGVTADKGRMIRIYSTAVFSVCCAAAFLSISLFFTYPLIVEVWMGKDMVLGRTETALFCISLFLTALRRPTGAFIDACGLFEREKFKSLAEAAISCAVTLFLTPRLGISGVLAGQISGSVLLSLWFEPYILFRYGFNEDPGMIVKGVLRAAPAVVLSFVLAFMLCGFIDNAAIGILPEIFARAGACGFSVMTVFGIIFFDSRTLADSFRYASRLLVG